MSYSFELIFEYRDDDDDEDDENEKYDDDEECNLAGQVELRKDGD